MRQAAQPNPDDLVGTLLTGGTEAGEHTVHFFGNNESITITHHADNRQIFVNGAIRAAEYLEGKEAGLYNMQNLLNGD